MKCQHGVDTSKWLCGSCRAIEKQKSRDQDAEDLRTGRKTAAQLRKENSWFAFPPDKVIIRYDKIGEKRVSEPVKIEPKQMRLEESCNGWCVHWPRPSGDSLQGWYSTKEEAEKVMNTCQNILNEEAKKMSNG